MPARLPDEELAPVEGAPPSQQVVQPTSFGIGAGAEQLASAATVGYRAAAYQARAQALEDQRANAPALQDLQGQLATNLAKNAVNYESPTFIADQKAQGQQITQQARQAAGYDTMPKGRQLQWDRSEQTLLDDHAKVAYDVQARYTESALMKGLDDQRDATSNQQLTGALGLIGGLETHITNNLMGQPNARQAFLDGSSAIAQDHWQNDILPGLVAQNTSPDDIAMYKARYDQRTSMAALDGASRLGIAQATYQQNHTDITTLQTVGTQASQIRANPDLYKTYTAPDGIATQTLTKLGEGKEADDVRATAGSELAEAAIQGTIDKGDTQHAQAMLTDPQFSALSKEARERLETSLAKDGPAAYQQATALAIARQGFDANAMAIATTGQGNGMTEQQLIAMGAKPEVVAEFNAKAEAGRQVFMANGGKPMADMTSAELKAIPHPTDVRDPLYQYKLAAATARDQELAKRADPVAYMSNLPEKGGKAGGKGWRGAGAQPAPGGAALDQQFQLWDSGGRNAQGAQVTTPQQAGDAWARAAYEGQLHMNPEGWKTTEAVFSNLQAKTMAEAIKNSDPQNLYGNTVKLTEKLDTLPTQLKLSDGSMVYPRQHAIYELERQGLPKSIEAAMLYFGGSPGEGKGLGIVLHGLSPEVQGVKLQPNEERDLDLAARTAAATYHVTARSPNDAYMYPAFIDMVKAGARGLKASGVAGNWSQLTKQALAPLTDPFDFEKTWRIDKSLSREQFRTDSYPGYIQPTFGAVSGKWAVSRGMDNATNYFTGPDQFGHVGGNLQIPPNSTLAPDQAGAAWASYIRRNGAWTNLDDHTFMLSVPGADGNRAPVLDNKGSPITLGDRQMANDGLFNRTSFANPTAPQHTISTPGGNPVNAAQPHVAAAAGAHAVAHGPPGPPPQNAGQPAVQRPSAAEGAPAAPGAGAPSAGEYGRNAAALAPDGGVPTGVPSGQPPPPSPSQAPAGPPPAAPAAPATSAQMNATQAMLQRLGASPRTVALFGGAEYGEPGGGAAPTSPFPNGLPPANVPPSRITELLRPGVITAESRGMSGKVSPAGAVGLMQLMPSVIHDYAPRLGLPDDPEFFRTHDEANVAVGTALMNDLTQRFMRGGYPMNGIPLALVAYNAGPGYVLGYTKNGQYHPGLLQLIGDPRNGAMSADEWIDKIPDKGIRRYAKQIYDATATRLAGVVGAGPAPPPQGQ